MPSIWRIAIVIGLVLLSSGSVSGGWGIYQQAMDSCESGYGVTIDRLDGNETASPSTKHVAYSSLSASEQQVFKEILTAETTPIYQSSNALDGLTQKVITYRGEQYETSPLFVSDCAHTWVVFQVVGGLTAVLGGVIVITTLGVRRL